MNVIAKSIKTLSEMNKTYWKQMILIHGFDEVKELIDEIISECEQKELYEKAFEYLTFIKENTPKLQTQ